MSKEYSLDLVHNSIDSLNESVDYYKIAIDDESKYKFSIILLFHFNELMLKYFVELLNPLLCYAVPYSNKIEKEKTISWSQAIQILKNAGRTIDEKLKKQIYDLADLRNNIVHYKFFMRQPNANRGPPDCQT